MLLQIIHQKLTLDVIARGLCNLFTLALGTMEHLNEDQAGWRFLLR